MDIWGVEAARLVHTYTDDVYLAPLFALVIIILYRFVSRKTAIILVLSLLLTKIVVWLMKFLFAVSRPDAAVITLDSYAFPSGHAAMSFTIASFAVWAYSCHVQASLFKKISVYTLIFIVAAYVSYTRIILGVHTWVQIGVGALIGLLIPHLIRKVLESIRRN